MSFKVGDTIECIEHGPSGNNITVGKRYTVLKIDTDGSTDPIITDDNNDRKVYYASRFKKVEKDMFVKGDILKCIRASKYTDGLTENKEYFCDGLNNDRCLTKAEVYIIDDNGSRESWFCSRFVKIEKGEEMVKKDLKDFQVDVINKEIYNQVLKITKANGFSIGGCMEEAGDFWQFLQITDNNISGNKYSSAY